MFVETSLSLHEPQLTGREGGRAGGGGRGKGGRAGGVGRLEGSGAAGGEGGEREGGREGSGAGGEGGWEGRAVGGEGGRGVRRVTRGEESGLGEALTASRVQGWSCRGMMGLARGGERRSAAAMVSGQF